MSRLDAAQQSALEAPVVRLGYFLEFSFTGGVARISTCSQSVVWGGYTWYGLGQLISLSQLTEAEGSESRALTVRIGGAQPEWLATAIGPVEEYRGRSAKLYMAPLDAGFQLIGTPVLAWRGIMDMVSMGLEEDSAGLEIKCETAAYALKRRPAYRINAAQHKLRHPGETGFDYLNDLLANPQLWLSKRFQSV